MSSELKACPFCGADATLHDGEGVCSYVKCSSCLATSGVYLNGHPKQSATRKSWNRRSPSPAVLALVEACKGLVTTLRSGDWGSQDETADEIDKAIGAVEREIGGA